MQVVEFVEVAEIKLLAVDLLTEILIKIKILIVRTNSDYDVGT